jgi:hypothetical protein
MSGWTQSGLRSYVGNTKDRNEGLGWVQIESASEFVKVNVMPRICCIGGYEYDLVSHR